MDGPRRHLEAVPDVGLGGRARTPVLDPVEARQLIVILCVSTPIGLRDRALDGASLFQIFQAYDFVAGRLVSGQNM